MSESEVEYIQHGVLLTPPARRPGWDNGDDPIMCICGSDLWYPHGYTRSGINHPIVCRISGERV